MGKVVEFNPWKEVINNVPFGSREFIREIAGGQLTVCYCWPRRYAAVFSRPNEDDLIIELKSVESIDGACRAAINQLNSLFKSQNICEK